MALLEQQMSGDTRIDPSGHTHDNTHGAKLRLGRGNFEMWVHIGGAPGNLL
jgi:hypothetical protein